MVPVGSQKHRMLFLKHYFHYLACGQVWLNLPVDDIIATLATIQS
jgi:hypothetical protein